MTARRIMVPMTPTEADQWQVLIGRDRDLVELRDRINAAITAAEARWSRQCGRKRNPRYRLTVNEAVLIRHLHDPTDVDADTPAWRRSSTARRERCATSSSAHASRPDAGGDQRAQVNSYASEVHAHGVA